MRSLRFPHFREHDGRTMRTMQAIRRRRKELMSQLILQQMEWRKNQSVDELLDYLQSTWLQDSGGDSH